MTSFLILQLDGVLQAWGDHTFEDFRPTVGFPTRSGLLGLLAACLGIDRSDIKNLSALDRSVYFTIRAEDRYVEDKGCATLRITDFHTVQNARKVDIRKSNEYPVVSRREYLCDAVFSVAVEQSAHVDYSLAQIEAAVKKPIYTPFLGRRSCPLNRPLFAAYVDAENALEALNKFSPRLGTMYSDSPLLEHDRELRLRDMPQYGRVRQFATRRVFIHASRRPNVSK